MTSPRTIPPAVRRVQVEAADPDVSAFVSANAGSGKTYVLAQRVVRLLLRGIDPANILCITFTKTAAADMANEVFKRLAGWTALDDAALDRRSRSRPAPSRRPVARAGAPAVCVGAGNAGRPEGADHPRLCTRRLHQFRSRPMSPRVSPCWTRPRPRNCSTDSP